MERCPKSFIRGRSFIHTNAVSKPCRGLKPDWKILHMCIHSQTPQTPLPLQHPYAQLRNPSYAHRNTVPSRSENRNIQGKILSTGGGTLKAQEGLELPGKVVEAVPNGTYFVLKGREKTQCWFPRLSFCPWYAGSNYPDNI